MTTPAPAGTTTTANARARLEAMLLVRGMLRVMTADERAAVVEPFCVHCWAERPEGGCNCMRDE